LSQLLSRSQTPVPVKVEIEKSAKKFDLDAFYEFLSSQGETEKIKKMQGRAEIEHMRQNAHN
jgi:hypothetical protein